MTNEATLCTILAMSIDWGYKIPDPSSEYARTIQRPFDLFGIFRGSPIYLEAKYASEFKSFDLQRIEDHQLENLIRIKSQCSTAYCWIAYGVHVSHGDNRVWIFDDLLEIEKRRLKHQNYLKKELETLPYYSVKKGILDLSSFIN